MVRKKQIDWYGIGVNMSTICIHDRVHRKYYLGMQDDFVCETCGDTFATQKELDEARAEAKTKKQQSQANEPA